MFERILWGSPLSASRMCNKLSPAPPVFTLTIATQMRASTACAVLLVAIVAVGVFAQEYPGCKVRPLC